MVYRMSVAGSRTVAVERVRNGERAWIDVSLVSAPDTPPRDPRTLGETSGLPGLTVVRVNPAVIAEYNLPLASEGVMVADPGPFGPRVGLRPGDLLLGVNGAIVLTGDDVARAMARPGRYELTVLRGNSRVSLRFRS